MRSSKSRSRSKGNRNRSVGNVVNRVFDSSGPEGKVRGTPQQIIDKYTQLAQDATLANDRVAAENFQQHAEHYTRLLSAAQKEQEARREQQEREQRERQQQREAQRHSDATEGDNNQNNGGPDASGQEDTSDALRTVETDNEEESSLVETPESKASKPRARRPRKPRSEPTDGTPPAEENA